VATLWRVADDADDLELAEALVRAAGGLAADMRRAGLTTEHKSSISDVVSAADYAAEKLIVDRLRIARPHDGVVGEEGTNHPGERTWFIDPVDGTYNFLSGLPTWCSAVALTDPTDDCPAAGRPGAGGAALGAIYHPAAEEMWLGGRNAATTCNGRPVPPLTDVPLARLSLATYLHPSRLADDGVRVPLLRAIQAAATVRMLGSGSIELAAVAAGRLGAWVQLDCPAWDWLPGAALIAAAGGGTAVLDTPGHRWHLAGNRQAVAELTELVLGG
jgi:myo-inositol-1(or 4)-monophosphatase